MKKLLLGIILASLSATNLYSSSTLINGRPALSGEFPEVVYISAGMSRCSASIIGPQTILTAAHCVKTGQTIHQVMNQIVFTAKCQQSPEYKLSGHDMALCKTDRVMKPGKFAVVASHGPKLGDKVELSGYGCLGSNGGGNDGILRVGEATVNILPVNTHWFETNDLTAACFGDSGGPSYLAMKDPMKDTHYVIGLNSQGDIKKRSLMTNLWLGTSQKFLKDFSVSQGVKICGVNLSCGKAAHAADKKCRKEKKRMDYYKEKLDKWSKAYDSCLL